MTDETEAFMDRAITAVVSVYRDETEADFVAQLMFMARAITAVVSVYRDEMDPHEIFTMGEAVGILMRIKEGHHKE